MSQRKNDVIHLVYYTFISVALLQLLFWFDDGWSKVESTNSQSVIIKKLPTFTIRNKKSGSIFSTKTLFDGS